MTGAVKPALKGLLSPHVLGVVGVAVVSCSLAGLGWGVAGVDKGSGWPGLSTIGPCAVQGHSEQVEHCSVTQTESATNYRFTWVME